MPSFTWNGYYLTLGLLAACTIIGISVAIRFRREVDDDLAPPTVKDVLDPLEKAYFSGLMHQSEIERIRESIEKSRAPTTVPPRAARPAKTSTTGTEITPDGSQWTDGSPSADHHGDGGGDAS